MKENLVKFSEIIAKILRKVLVDVVHSSERSEMLISFKLEQYCANKVVILNQRPQLRRNTLFLVEIVKRICIFEKLTIILAQNLIKINTSR